MTKCFIISLIIQGILFTEKYNYFFYIINLCQFISCVFSFNLDLEQWRPCHKMCTCLLGHLWRRVAIRKTVGPSTWSGIWCFTSSQWAKAKASPESRCSECECDPNLLTLAWPSSNRVPFSLAVDQKTNNCLKDWAAIAHIDFGGFFCFAFFVVWKK